MRTVRRHSLLPLLLAALLVPALDGCAALHFERPGVEVVDVGLQSVGLLESTVALTVRVQNPNGFRLPIDRGSYTLFLAGDRIGTGSTMTPLEVPAHGTRDEQIVLQLDNGRLLARLRDLVRGGGVQYRVEADHYVDVVGFRNRPFHSVATGTLDLRDRLHPSR